MFSLEDSENMQECHMSQSLRHDVKPVEKHYGMRVEHELQCSHVTFINHKVTVCIIFYGLMMRSIRMVIVPLGCSGLQIQIQHERSPVHIQSSLDLSYGNQWNQGSNKQRVLLSQSIKNQSVQSLTSYALEVKPFHIWHILLYCTAARSIVQS